MKKLRMYTDITYLLLIAATFGAVMVLGVFVAPVIFHSEMLLPIALLDNYNEGMLMAEVFRRFSYWCYLLVLAVVLFELNEYKHFRRDRISGIAALFTVATSLLFSAVYTPKILEMQDAGAEATMSDTFANIHTASEIDFKILAASLLILFFRRVMLLRTIQRG